RRCCACALPHSHVLPGCTIRLSAPPSHPPRVTLMPPPPPPFLPPPPPPPPLSAPGPPLSAPAAPDKPRDPPPRPNRVAVSTYSYWQFRNRELRNIETCIDLAAEMGFDGVEILHRQMEREDNDYLQRLQRRAFLL